MTEDFHNNNYKVFHFLWIFAMLFHFTKIWSSPSPHFTLASYMLPIVCIIFLQRIHSLPLFLLVLLLQIFDAVVHPILYGHHLVQSTSWFFTSVVCISIVVVYLIMVMERKFHFATITPQKLFRRYAPIVRMQVVILYFFAVFHKCNAGYFAIPVKFMNGHFEPYDAIIGIAQETCVLLLLCFYRTHFIGLIVAFLLHFVLGLYGFTQFFLMFAVLSLFLHEDQLIAICKKMQDLRVGRREIVALQLLMGTLVVFAFIFDDHKYRVLRYCNIVVFAMSGVFVARVFLMSKLHFKLQKVSHGFVWRDAFLPLLFFMWFSLPYVGITSHPCATMFSYLYANNNQSNHYIVPGSLQIDALQNEVAVITEVDGGWEYPLGIEVPYFGLRRKLIHDVYHRKAPQKLVFVYKGETTTVRDGKLSDKIIWDYLPFNYNYRMWVVYQLKLRQMERKKQKARQK